MAEPNGSGLTIEQPFPERVTTSQVTDVGKLLAGEPLEDEDDNETEQAAASTAEGAGAGEPADRGGDSEQAAVPAIALGEGESLDVAAMAKHLGVSEEELYTMSIPMGQDRGSVSFGALKDAWRDQENVADRGQRVTEQANEMMAHRRTMQTTMNMLADKYGSEALQEAARAAELDGERYTHQEQAALLVRFPEWGEASTYAAARGEMLEFAQGYGFSEAEFSGVLDHRLVALLRDAQQLKARLGKAKQAAAEARAGTDSRGQRPQGRAPRKPAERHKAIKDKARSSGMVGDMTAAASAIISEN